VRCGLGPALVVALAALLAGCVANGPVMPASTCLADFMANERELRAARIRDAQSQLVGGFPFLRSDRLQAALAATVDTPAAKRAWLARAAALDHHARHFELARLGRGSVPAARLDACRDELVESLQDDRAAWPRLQAGSKVADAYLAWRRVVGLYPLFAPVARAGAARLAREFDVRFVDTLNPNAGQRYTLAPPRAATVSVPTLSRDALGLLRIDAATAAALLRHHAPDLVMRGDTDADRPGRIDLSLPSRVDPRDPVLYTQVQQGLFARRAHVQLIYSWWFSARPARHALDVLAGPLDGLTLRVTLDEDGEVLLYDLMHNCGCYHMFLPGPRLVFDPERRGLEESGWLPLSLPRDWRSDRLLLELDAGSHYVRAIARAPASANGRARTYRLRAQDELRVLASPQGGYASLFDAHGLVPRTTRLERFILWPFGVRAAGSMRQWGHHATAFVGRRHFDDPDLIERYFERAPAR